MNYILQKDFNWFGRNIPKGTLYVQHGADYWWPVIGAQQVHVPTMQIDYMTIRNNPEWFLQEPIVVSLFEGRFGNAGCEMTYIHTFHTDKPIHEHLRGRIEQLIQEVINK